MTATVDDDSRPMPAAVQLAGLALVGGAIALVIAMGLIAARPVVGQALEPRVAGLLLAAAVLLLPAMPAVYAVQALSLVATLHRWQPFSGSAAPSAKQSPSITQKSSAVVWTQPPRPSHASSVQAVRSSHAYAVPPQLAPAHASSLVHGSPSSQVMATAGADQAVAELAGSHTRQVVASARASAA